MGVIILPLPSTAFPQPVLLFLGIGVLPAVIFLASSAPLNQSSSVVAPLGLEGRISSNCVTSPSIPVSIRVKDGRGGRVDIAGPRIEGDTSGREGELDEDVGMGLTTICTGRGLRLFATGTTGRLVLSLHSPSGALFLTTEGRGAGFETFLDDDEDDRGPDPVVALMGIREAGYEGGGGARALEVEAIGDGRIGVGRGSLIVLTILGR